jgi:hypothetical protein
LPHWNASALDDPGLAEGRTTKKISRLIPVRVVRASA